MGNNQTQSNTLNKRSQLRFNGLYNFTGILVSLSTD